MSSRNPVEGEDYLIDWYALAGVPRDASRKEIRDAIDKQLMECHPDRFEGIGEYFRSQMERRAGHLARARKVLSNSANRATYDAQLADWKGPVSTSGGPVVDPTFSGFSFDSLIENMGHSDTDTETLMKDIALQLSGFDASTYEFFANQAREKGSIPDEMRVPYLVQIKNRDKYLGILESLRWKAMGYQNYNALPHVDHADHVEDELASLKARISEDVAQQALLIAAGHRVLLPAPAGDVSKNPLALNEHYSNLVGVHITQQEELLRPIVAERDKLLVELFMVEGQPRYHPLTKCYTRKVVLEIKVGDTFYHEAFSLRGTKAKVMECPLAQQLPSDEVAAELVAQGFTLLTVTMVADVDPRSVLRAALDFHFQKLPRQRSKKV